MKHKISCLVFLHSKLEAVWHNFYARQILDTGSVRRGNQGLSMGQSSEKFHGARWGRKKIHGGGRTARRDKTLTGAGCTAVH